MLYTKLNLLHDRVKQNLTRVRTGDVSRVRWNADLKELSALTLSLQGIDAEVIVGILNTLLRAYAIVGTLSSGDTRLSYSIRENFRDGYAVLIQFGDKEPLLFGTKYAAVQFLCHKVNEGLMNL